jgi:hypothetical protein
MMLRAETEWGETMPIGWNEVVGADTMRIATTGRSFMPPLSRPTPDGEEQAAGRIVQSPDQV